MRILFVEDDLELKDLMTAVFEDEGHTVDSYTDSETALKKFKYNYYNLLIADNILPDMYGVDLVKEMHKRDPRVKSVIISASEVKPELSKLKRYGVKEIMKKPFNIDGLLNLIEKL